MSAITADPATTLMQQSSIFDERMTNGVGGISDDDDLPMQHLIIGDDSGSGLPSSDASITNHRPNSPSPLMLLLDDRDSTSPLVGNLDSHCPYCHKPYRKPRVLHCLHSMCEDCIIAQLDGRRPDLTPTAGIEFELEPTTTTNGQQVCPPPGVIRCPTCQQDSNVGNDMRFVTQLLLDHVRINETEAKSIDKIERPCESCKSEEAATAHCQNCASNLCPNCVTAHNFMRLFDGHKVVSFEDIKRATETNQQLLLHRPVICPLHAETYRAFCYSCERLVCSECETHDHRTPEHRVNEASEQLDQFVRNGLDDLCQKTEEKGKLSSNVQSLFDQHIGELGDKVECAKENVERTFAEFHDLLDAHKQLLLSLIDKARDDHEAHIDDASQRIINNVEKMTDAVRFTRRLVTFADTIELLDSRKVVMQQMTHLMHSVPSTAISVDLAYVVDTNRFRQALHACCGEIRQDIISGPGQSTINPTHLKPSILDLSPPPTQLIGPAPPMMVNPIVDSNAPEMIGRGANGANWMSTNAHNNNTNDYARASQSYVANGPGTIGMERSRSVRNGHVASSITVVGNNQHHNIRPMITSSSSQQTLANVVAAPPPPWSNDEQFSQLARQMAGISTTSMGSVMYNQPSTYVESSWTNAAAAVGTYTGQQSQQHQQQLYGGGNEFNPFCIETSPPMSSSSVAWANPIEQQRRMTDSTTQWNPTIDYSQGPPAVAYAEMLMTLQQQQQQLPNAMFSQQQQMAMPVVARSIRRTPVDEASVHSDRTSCTTPSDHGNATGGGNSKLCMPMTSRLVFGSLGNGRNQFNSPHGFCLNPDDDIVVADTNNHRVVVISKNGDFLFQFGTAGKLDGNLFYPRKVAVIRGSNPRDIRYVVCDRGNERSRMQVFNARGEYIKKIEIRYVDIVAGLVVDRNGKIVIVDSVSPTVFCVNSETGILEKWFDCAEFMKEPSDIAVFAGELYICDFKANCVCVFNEDGRFLRKIGSGDCTPYPNAIDISDEGDVMVGHSHGNKFQLAVFRRSGELIQHFECNSVKVSRCCGVRVTSDGYVVTLAKNNHQLLVFDQLHVFAHN